MPTDSEFKKIVRARMEITGENYVRAQRACLEAARAAIPQEHERALDETSKEEGAT